MNFEALWNNSDIGTEALSERHSYDIGNGSSPEFPRVAAYFAAEPDIDSPEWEDWQRTKCRLLLGEGRRARSGRGYTVFPDDPAINSAILGCAGKFLPFVFDERGLPPEEVRDLCSHLALYGVEVMADGNYSTLFLAKEATKYFRKKGTATSLPEHLLENRGSVEVSEPAFGFKPATMSRVDLVLAGEEWGEEHEMGVDNSHITGRNPGTMAGDE